MNELKKELGEKVFEFRVKHNLTQGEFAKKAFLSKTTIYQLEKGTLKPSPFTVGKVKLVLEGGKEKNEI